MSIAKLIASRLRRRRAHIYCVGTAKSGTHSIADLFRDRVRAEHEVHSEALIHRVIDHADDEVGNARLKRYLQWRDRELKLEIDSSQLNVFFIEILVDAFPKARFILTIRDPYSWLDSLVNHSLSDGISDAWLKMRDYRFRPDLHAHKPQERALEQRGLYTLDGYLAYWRYHNQRVLTAVPEDRLLVVRTDEITERASEIITFAGLAGAASANASTHSFKARQKYNLLDDIDQTFLTHKIAEHCGDLTRRFFPDMVAAGRPYADLA